jgi:hypothetical protein
MSTTQKSINEKKVESKETLCVPNIHFELCEEINFDENAASKTDVKEITQKYYHYSSSVRLVTIPKLADGSCGIHLSKSKWDPYPYISGIDKSSPAEDSSIKIGDCVLEVWCVRNETSDLDNIYYT